MPFDAFLLRQLSHRWNTSWAGLEVASVLADKSRLALQGWHPATRQKLSILIVLETGLARIHETRHPLAWPKALQPVFTRLGAFTIDQVFTPSLDRILWLGITWRDDWGTAVHGFMVIELTGRLTNIMVLNQDHIILGALRRPSANANSRSIQPGQPYTPPPAFANPCITHAVKDLPPAAKDLATLPEWSWDTFCNDLNSYRLPFYHLRHEGHEDVWIAPRPGWEASPIPDPDAILDELFWRIDRERRIANLQQQLVSHWKDRYNHLSAKLAEAENGARENPETYKEQGDLWYAYQYLFQDPHVQEYHVPSLSNPSQTITLTLQEGKTPPQMADACYRAYKKSKHRVAANQRLVTVLSEERTAAKAAWDDALAPQSEEELRKKLADIAPRMRHRVQNAQQFRRFTSQGGYDIWVGRSREENQELTIRRARPDDLWFHVKQSPGSHVVLFCGKANPSLEDLLDAAQLAVYYSPAKHSSTVAVDYTRRKFVRKRPHAEAGQVLYEREKTLYITPEPDRLRRLGATSDKLATDI